MTANMELSRILAICFISWIHFAKIASTEGLLRCDLNQGQCREGNETHFHVVTCANAGPVNLTCPVGHTIYIQSAFWGRGTGRHCGQEGSWRVKRCSRSISVTSIPCHDMISQCWLPLRDRNNSLVYGDTCVKDLNTTVGMKNILEKSIHMDIKYYCHPPQRSGDNSTQTVIMPMIYVSSGIKQTYGHSENRAKWSFVTTQPVNGSDATTRGTIFLIDMTASPSGSAGVGIGIGITAALIVFIIISVLVFIWWRRRPQTKYIKENEAVYVPTHPDDVAPPAPNCNQTNPTYGQQAPETHEYDYATVDQDTDTNGSGKEDHYSDPQYATVDENEVNNQNGSVTTDKSGLPQSPQYETVYPDDTELIYDAEYGAVNFTENDLYKR